MDENHSISDGESQTFTIKPASIEDATLGVILDKTYRRQAIIPEDSEINVYLNGILLVKDTDYGITFASNTEVGTATATIAGKGNYTGNTTVDAFTIIPLTAVLEWEDTDSLVYNGTNQYPGCKVANLYSGDTCDVTVIAENAVHVGTYAAVADELSNKNYELPKDSSKVKSFNIIPKEAALAWDELVFTYDGKEHCATATVSNLVSGDECEVTVTGAAKAAGEHTAEATVLSNSDYALPATTTQTYKINPKSIKADDVEIAAIDDQEYTGSAITPKPVITDDDTGTLAEGTDYKLEYSDNVNAGTATITITGMGNYSESRTTTFTIVPKPIKAAWAAAIPNQTYTGYELEPTLTITDPDRAVELKLDTDYTVKYEDNINVADKPVVTVTGIGNYTADFTTTFKIDPKNIGDESIAIAAIDDQVYTTQPIEPTLTVTDKAREDAKLVEDTDFTVAYSNNINVSDTTPEKAATATITGTGNYTGTNSTTFIIIRKPVKVITFKVNGPTEDSIRLGGPDESLYHTIDIDAEADEAMTVTITDDGAAVTTIQNVTAGTLTIKGDAINGVNLDLSGDKTYTINAEYVDKDNLTTAETTSASAPPAEGAEAKFVYDKTAKAITVKPLYNRAAKGVGVALPEGYRMVQFTSSGAGTDFIATNPASLPAGDHTIPFNVGENPKLKSTAKGGTFTGKYEDYVGNAGTVDTQEILKSSGTISIDSVEPGINDAGRIANTANLTFTVRMNAEGGYAEEATGSVFGTRTLTQGEQSITVSASSLGADVTNTPSLAFDDLEGSATFRSFIYDPVCDDPVLTFMPYAGCYYLMGVAEPYAQLVMEVNGEKVTGSADAFGVFALKMPLVEEGDIITLKVTDQAGNMTLMTYRVEAEADDIVMVSFMGGRVYTSAHNARPGEKADWTMILTASVDDLKAGKVNVPIYAGNMVSIGRMSVKMDENNTLSYSYTLDDGIEMLSEKFIANTKLDKDAFIAQVGIEVDPKGTQITDIKKGVLYLSCKMSAKVPTDKLKETFQTEKIKDSEEKKQYRDIQNGKLD